MTSQEQITIMASAIKQAIKVMSDRFGSTEEEVARVIQELKSSMQTPLAVPAIPAADA
jgi:hypothetical protein